MIAKLKNILVIIPARKGSKRIPNKNVKKIFGQPMIYWPLKVLSKMFPAENVLVSTDSEMVKTLVEKKGLIIPFKRPSNLSGDFTGTTEVIKHAADWYELNVRKVEYVLTIYPTAVMLSEADIHLAVDMLINDINCDFVMSAVAFDFPIQRAVFENNNGYAEAHEPNNYAKRSQDFVKALHDAGQFYLSRIESVRKGKLLTNSRVKLCLLNRNKIVDIDTVEDFEVAEDKLRFEKTGCVDDPWCFKTLNE